MKSKLGTDKMEGAIFWLPCSGCDGETRHIVLKAVETKLDTEDGFYWDDFAIVQCQGCETISFRRCWRWSEDMEPDGKDGERLIDHVELYPPRLAGRKEIRGILELPDRVRRVYRETRKALIEDLPVLAGVGIRAIVEAVCTDKDAKARNLQMQIDELVKMGVLTTDGAKVLHSTRLMGNKAAHEVKAHTLEELSIAMDVIEHLLTGVYVMPVKAKRISAVKHS